MSAIRQGNLKVFKIKYAYQDYKALLTHDGIRPGEIKEKGVGVLLFPPEERGSIALSYVYLRSREFRNEVLITIPVNEFHAASRSSNFTFLGGKI